MNSCTLTKEFTATHSRMSLSYAPHGDVTKHIWNDHGSGGNKCIYFIDPRDRLHDWLRVLFDLCADSPTLYLLDDLAASGTLKKKKDMLSELAFSGRHAKQYVWVLTQKYNAVSEDLREQTKWTALFHCKDRDSFDDCLRENDVVPADERAAVRAKLATQKHAKLLLKTKQPAAYIVL